LTYENYIKGRLVDFVVNEAYRYGGTDAMFAVAQVMKNRVDAGWQGGNWKRVIDDAPNFAANEYGRAEPVDPKDMMFRKILAGIDDIYHGTADDTNVNIDGDTKLVSLYYCDPGLPARQWFRDNIFGDYVNHPRIAQVAQLTFFG
jgi:hypothetical protein